MQLNVVKIGEKEQQTKTRT